MPVNLSVKNVPDDLAQRLRERAAANHRSLQRELVSILEQAVSAAPELSERREVEGRAIAGRPSVRRCSGTCPSANSRYRAGRRFLNLNHAALRLLEHGLEQ